MLFSRVDPRQPRLQSQAFTTSIKRAGRGPVAVDNRYDSSVYHWNCMVNIKAKMATLQRKLDGHQIKYDLLHVQHVEDIARQEQLNEVNDEKLILQLQMDELKQNMQKLNAKKRTIDLGEDVNDNGDDEDGDDGENEYDFNDGFIVDDRVPVGVRQPPVNSQQQPFITESTDSTNQNDQGMPQLEVENSEREIKEPETTSPTQQLANSLGRFSIGHTQISNSVSQSRPMVKKQKKSGNSRRKVPKLIKFDTAY